MDQNSKNLYFDRDQNKQTKLAFKIFDLDKKDQAMDVLTYGAKLRRVSRWGKLVHDCFFYILEEDNGILQWLSKKKLFQKSRIDLRNVTQVYETVPEVYKYFLNLNKLSLLRLVTNDSKELVLIFDSIEQKELWQQGLQIFIQQAIDRYIMGNPCKNIVDELFLLGDKDSSLGLSYDEVKSLLNRMHIDVNKKYLKDFFAKYDTNHNQQIEKEEFEQFVFDIMEKPELKPMYRKYHDDHTGQQGMSIEQLQKFFLVEQSQELSLEEITLIVQKYGDNAKFINFITFVNIIFSINNSLTNNQKLIQEQDMNKPLTCYYINSSHNTYLLSNQLTGKSSLEAYINAFQRGVKCVELDCWDGGEDGEPIVYHGHTLTSKIFFKDILKCIVQHGFVTSPYPVILSLEIHCCPKQQDTMAAYLKQLLNQRLLIIPQDHSQYTHYPSPHELMNKIIVKGTGLLQDIYRNIQLQAEPQVALESEDEDLTFEYDSDEDQAQIIGTEQKIVINQNILSKQATISTQQETDLHLQTYNQSTDLLEFMTIQDELSFEEHGVKHLIHNAPQLNSQIYTAFNLQNPDFDNFRNYHVYLDLQNKKLAQDQKKLISDTKSPYHGLINDQGSWVDQDQWDQKSNANNSMLKEKSVLPRQQDFSNHTSQANQTIPQINENIEINIPAYQEPLVEIRKKSTLQTFIPMENRKIKLVPRKSAFNFNIGSFGTKKQIMDQQQMIQKQVIQNIQDKRSRSNKEKKKEPSKKQVFKTTINLVKCLSLISFRLTFERNREVWFVTSLSESQIEIVIKKNEYQFIKFHRRFFSRVYPKATRFDSSNYDPMPGFVVGSQLIALNYQTNDENLLLNIIMFQNNSNSGYVLKPQFLLHDPIINRVFSKEEKYFYKIFFDKPVVKLLINFISAQQLRPENVSDAKYVLDPYVDVYIRGSSQDEEKNTPQKSQIIKNNGFNPAFNFQVELYLWVPELAFVVMRVFDKDVLGKDNRIGINMVQVTNLRSGYRVVPLLDKKLNVIDNSYLFVHVEIVKL